MTLTLDELRAMPATTLTVTLECAGNGRIGLMPLPTGEPWAGNAVGTARWTGVPLHLILERPLPARSGVEVSFEGADHGPYKGGPDIPFGRALALDRALDPAAEVLVAWAMNDAPLPPDHGAPLRLIVPGWYGMASVKWLAKIEVLTAPTWASSRRSPISTNGPTGREAVTTIRPRALITDPAPGDDAPARPVHRSRQSLVRHRPDHRVEVSVDGRGRVAARPRRATDRALRVAGVDVSNGRAPNPGRHVLRARATDASGDLPARQPGVEPPRLRQQRRAGAGLRRAISAGCNTRRE